MTGTIREKGSAEDPKGLIFEAFRIDGITVEECRTIFLDWALSLPVERDTHATLAQLEAHYAPLFPGHPMMDVMREGLVSMAAPRRRGGWRSRPRN